MNEQAFNRLKVGLDDLKAELLRSGITFKNEVDEPWFNLAPKKKKNYMVWTKKFWLNYSNVLLELLMEKEQAYMLTKDAKKIK